MSPNIKDLAVSKETQKIVVKKLSSDQLFLLLVLGILSMLYYCMINKMSSQIDAINERLDKLIDLNSQNLLTLKSHLTQDENVKVTK